MTVFAVANALMAALFAYAAAVNLNDPDPVRWVTIYLSAALTSAAAYSRRLPLAVPAVLSAVAFVWAATVAWGGIGESHPMKGFPQMGILREEIVREGLGLTTVAAWMAVLAVRISRSAAPADAPPPTGRGS